MYVGISLPLEAVWRDSSARERRWPDLLLRLLGRLAAGEVRLQVRDSGALALDPLLELSGQRQGLFLRIGVTRAVTDSAQWRRRHVLGHGDRIPSHMPGQTGMEPPR